MPADGDGGTGPARPTLPRIASVTAARGSGPAAPGRLRAPSIAGVVGFGFVLGGFCLGLRPFFDNSFFTHLATGRIIVESGIPRADPYSFTAAGEPWVVQSWLVSLLLGAVERAGGDVGVRVLAGLLLATLLGLAWRLTSAAGSLIPRLAITGLFLVTCTPFFTPRPLLVGLVLLALLLVVVTEHRDPRWLVPIMWLWVNSHGSFPLGLVVIGTFAVGSWLDGDRSRSPWRPLVWAVGGTALGAVNPLGPVLLTFPVTLLGKMEILQRVIEWQSPSFSTTLGRLFLVQIVVAILVLVRRPSYRSAVPLVVFGAAALLGQRNIPDTSLVLLPGLAVGLSGLGHIDGRERGVVPTALAAVMVVIAILAASTQLAQPAFDLSTYPTDGLAWLDQRGQLGPSGRVATEDTVGNTIEILRGADAGAFFDDRYDMYPIALSRDYVKVHVAELGWQEALDRHDVRYLLWSRNEPVAQLVAASSDWRILYQDGLVFIACRRGAGAPDC